MHIVDGSTIPWPFDERRSAPPSQYRGSHCFVLREGDALEQAAAALGRDPAGLCLKVFFIPMGVSETLHTYFWGRERPGHDRAEERDEGRISSLWEATAIQNLCWAGYYAPRVYGVVLVERRGASFPAQLTEFLNGTRCNDVGQMREMTAQIAEYLSKFGCLPATTRKILAPRDFVDGKCIDFQGFRFTDLTERGVVSYVKETGRYGKSNYQSVRGGAHRDAPLLGANPRDTEQRVGEMGLDAINFEGKNVLDVGCNMGALCHYAADRGARRVLGVDLEPQIKAARVLAAYLSYWNVDFEVLDVREGPDEGVASLRPYDVTLFLSMCAHVGLPEWVCEVSDVLIFEENAMGSKFKTDEWIAHLKERFDWVKLVGHTTDHNPKFPKPVIFAGRHQ